MGLPHKSGTPVNRLQTCRTCNAEPQYSFQLIPASTPLPILNNRFRIGYRYDHDLAVTDGSLLNVFTAGSGFDLNVHTQAGERAPSQHVPSPILPVPQLSRQQTLSMGPFALLLARWCPDVCQRLLWTARCRCSAGDLANLFSDLDSGLGNRLFDSPGATSPGETLSHLRLPQVTASSLL